MDAVVVYKANPESLQAVLGLLRKEGFNPTTLENPSSADVLSGAGKAAYLISVTVPTDEAPGARSVLRKWDEARLSEVNKMTSKLGGPFVLSLMIVLVLALIFLLAGMLSNAAALLFVIWLVVFALAANAEKIIHKIKRSPGR
ncbi:MAG: hypothetical protein ABIF19_04035 [Planctomycetota bacterium]